MGKLLSVCIPSYNMETYLAKNLRSFLALSCSDELELIIVNDGSTDKTLEIANEYRRNHPNTIVVIDKPNGHYGSCINAALKIATGKYFRIVDADDWIKTDNLKSFLEILEDIDTDVVYTRFDNVYEEGGKVSMNEDPGNMIWNMVSDLNTLKIDSYVHMHQITYKTSFLRNINYHQTEGVCYTDTEYVFKPLCQAKSIYCSDLVIYQYRIGRDDQSMSPKVLMKNFSHLKKVLDSIIDFPKPEQINQNYAFLRQYYIRVLLGMLIDCMYASRCKNKEWDSSLRLICNDLQSQGFDLSQYESYSIRGCHWFKWWKDNSIFSKLKLRILFGLIGLRQ